ncbi:MAG: ABC transporter ATP-binding protein [Deferribacteres bacterium]|nr:ABC transporter ATP-binding protein [candidate division KSB1 bacterium]MCB9504188.1 ABC transporter ATP-binding protein [Deferribacteres bacterium]
MQPILITSNLKKSYSLGVKHQINVLDNVDMVARRGEVIAIIGHSGVGKSTLLHLIGALDRPDSGSIEIDGHSILKYDDRTLARFRNLEIGFIFQFHHLLQEFTALENVMMPALISGKRLRECKSRAIQLLAKVGLNNRSDHKPGELSGGEQQRVAVARALMNAPKLILADEPSGNLDAKSANELHQLLWSLSRKEAQTIIVVTHNMELARMADRRIHLREGQAFEE